MAHIGDPVQKYIKGGFRHSAYPLTVDIENHLEFHCEGVNYNSFDSSLTDTINPYLSKLIDNYRPSESEKTKNYRRQIYTGITQSPCHKVLNSLKKIVKSQDWMIDFSKSLKPATIKEGETLEDYTEKKYPFFQSVENWAYTIGMKQFITDPNGLFYVIPRSFQVQENEFIQPVIHHVNSRDVYQFTDEIAVFKTNKTSIIDIGGIEKRVPVFMVLYPNEIWEAVQINAKGDFSFEPVFVHNLGQLPAWKSGGNLKEIRDSVKIFDSFIS